MRAGDRTPAERLRRCPTARAKTSGTDSAARAEGERERPRQPRHSRHLVEVCRRSLIALTTREKYNTGQGCGHGALQTTHRILCHALDSGLFRQSLPETTIEALRTVCSNDTL